MPPAVSSSASSTRHADTLTSCVLDLVVSSALVAGAPFQLLQWLHVPLSGLALLLTPRLLLCALSFIIGASFKDVIWAMSRASG